MGPPPKGSGIHIHPAVITTLNLVFVAILTAILSSLLTYRSFGKFYPNARDVIGQLKGGNFSARFNVNRNDEIGDSMLAFNEMAEEIQKYVNTIKDSESNRIRLLQELAHDLRTPIASLKNVVETLSTKREKMSKNQEKEFFSLAEYEIDYFEKLVEDLLFLAKMSEPKYKIKNESLNINQLIKSEIQRNKESSIEVTLNTSLKDDVFICGDQHLLQRLVRNILENAISFAKSNIQINVTIENDQVILEFLDDGPGITDEMLKSFGTRKTSRRISTIYKEKRISTGLGSVIMKNVVNLYKGKISARNIFNNGKRLVLT